MKKQLIKNTALAVVAGVTALVPTFAAETAESKFDQDREAILAMVGEYDVNFHFEETVALQKNYELTEPYDESAKELVVLVEDTPKQIILQHLLVVNGTRVIKHWGQIWTYEDRNITTFRGHNTWETNQVPAATVSGTWSQFVTQVDDSPRYEGFGEWTHVNGVSTWESETWRPLPRREYSKRDDYDVVVATNRQIVTPDGWVHEQSNSKLVHRDGEADRLIAREIGLNTYSHSSAGREAFGAASELWEKDGARWVAILKEWQKIVGQANVKIAVKDGWTWRKFTRIYDSLEKRADGDMEKFSESIAENLKDGLEISPVKPDADIAGR